jgi:LacI family transcriptional regulator
VVAYNDLMALGLISELTDTRPRVPEDVAVVGFDDIPAARLARPALTTIATPLGFMGETGIRNLIALINGAQHHNPSGLVLPVQLKVRGSTGQHRARHTLPSPRSAPSPSAGPPPHQPDEPPGRLAVGL